MDLLEMFVELVIEKIFNLNNVVKNECIKY